jgi:hypothetical protein
MELNESARMMAARDHLVREVERVSRRRRPALIPALGLVLIGLLVGSATSAAVAVVVNHSQHDASFVELPAPTLGEELPGAPIVSVVGDPVVFTVTESTTIKVTAPVEATDIRVGLSCSRTGGMEITTPVGQLACTHTASAEFSSGVGFPVAGSEVTFDVRSDGSPSSLAIQFVRETQTPWSVNSAGQTYGSANSSGFPDLIAVVGNGVGGMPTVGYARSAYVVRPTSDKLAEWKRELLEVYPDGAIPLTTGDGQSVIGQFSVDHDALDVWLDRLWAEISEKFPEANRPQVGANGASVVASQWTGAITACLTAAGLTNEWIDSDAIPAKQEQALSLYRCWASVPLSIVDRATP